MNPIEKLRRTGRTTRMLKHAVELAQSGKAVYVIADNMRDVNRLTNELRMLIPLDSPAPLLGIKVETPDSMGSFDWEAFRTPGSWPNCIFLVDHHAIEDRFRRVIEMLHAYDE